MAKKFAVFDIDGTLIRWQLFHAIMDELGSQGHIPLETYQHIKAARMGWKRRTHGAAFKDYERLLVEVHDTLLKTLPVKKFDQAVKTVIEEYKDQAYAYTRDLIKNLKSQNYVLLAISGSHKELIEQLAQHYGFDAFIGTDYPRENGHFSGEIIHHASDKKKVLAALVKKHGLSYESSIGIGDSATDIPMLELVETPIAFNPDQILLATAKNNGWKIVVERKNVIYELKAQDGRYLLA